MVTLEVTVEELAKCFLKQYPAQDAGCIVDQQLEYFLLHQIFTLSFFFFNLISVHRLPCFRGRPLSGPAYRASRASLSFQRLQTLEQLVIAFHKKAILLLNGANPKQENLEEVIVHELLHLKLYPLDQVTESLITANYEEGSAAYRSYQFPAEMSIKA